MQIDYDIVGRKRAILDHTVLTHICMRTRGYMCVCLCVFVWGVSHASCVCVCVCVCMYVRRYTHAEINWQLNKEIIIRFPTPLEDSIK